MDMIRYQNPQYFHLLWLLLPLFLFFIYTKLSYRKKVGHFISPFIQSKLADSYSRPKSWLKKILLVLALFFGIIAMVNPKIGTKLVEAKREGIDIAIALDLSRSMQAEDITPNRISKTKLVVKRFIEKLEGDRVALVGFTSKAFVQCPLTGDYDAAGMFLDILKPSMMPQDGTSLAEAVTKAASCFDEKDKKHKLIIIVSDGEDHEENLDNAISEAKDKGAIIYTIGIGSLEGVPIPVQGGFLKDSQGNTVITRLDEVKLRKLASDGRGNYYHAGVGTADLEDIFTDIAKIEKKEYSAKTFEDFEDRFQPFLLLSLLCLVLELAISEKKKERLA